MPRFKLTPHVWYSEDGKLMFRSDEWGLIDIIPVHPPKVQIPTFSALSHPYQAHQFHIHWAL